MTYTTTPVVINDLFDPDAHQTIIRFMDEWSHLLQVVSDVSEPDSPAKFGRRYANNVGFFVQIHKQLTEFASDLFGEKVIPSYSFLSMYEKDGICPLHIDRPQCRYTIDYLIRQEQTEPWPICIGPQMGSKELGKIEQTPLRSEDDRQAVIDSVDWTTVNLTPNDAVCYSGTNAWHYRPEASQGKVDLVFFHFVPKGFRGSLD